MAEATLTRDIVQTWVQANEKRLRDNIEGLSELELTAIQVTPEWNAVDILRHIWVWGELCSRCLADWHGGRDWILTFASEDIFNMEMVAARAHANLATILDGIDSAYQCYADTIASCSDSELGERDAAPWGQQMTRLEMIASNLGHDREHIDQLEAARPTIR
jgi:hypothetical protein